MTNLQFTTPIVDKLKEYCQNHHIPFYTPGHKRGSGINPLLQDLLRKNLFLSDLTELPELDNLFKPEGVIKLALDLASQTFGSDKTWFLINGSTSGIIAAILATCHPGDKIILPRNIHKSVISGLILSGAIPIFIKPVYDQDWQIFYSITPESLKETLNIHSDAKAVMIVYPTYEGICGNIQEIVKITHEYHIPLLVDEAHGAHFHFHPQLPISALKAGADLSVQSSHKTLSSLTQTSMLHLQGNLINPEILNKSLEMVLSSSPNYILLASLDAARQQMATEGEFLMSKTLELAKVARNKISQITGLRVLELNKKPGFENLDQTRLTIKVSGLGLNGYLADDILTEKFGIISELASRENITFIISLGNTQTDIEKLVTGLTKLAENYGNGQTQKMTPSVTFPDDCDHSMRLSPREAFFAATKMIPLTAANQCISAEMICPYPPGIPVLIPGERITEKIIDSLQQAIALGCTITGCSDPSLNQIKIIDN